METKAYCQNPNMEEAINRLCDLFEYGHLRASADPIRFLHDVCEEIIELRRMCIVDAV